MRLLDIDSYYFQLGKRKTSINFLKNVGLKLFKYMLIHFEQSNYDVIINNYEMILEAHENDFGTKRTPPRWEIIAPPRGSENSATPPQAQYSCIHPFMWTCQFEIPSFYYVSSSNINKDIPASATPHIILRLELIAVIIAQQSTGWSDPYSPSSDDDLSLASRR